MDNKNVVYKNSFIFKLFIVKMQFGGEHIQLLSIALSAYMGIYFN